MGWGRQDMKKVKPTRDTGRVQPELRQNLSEAAEKLDTKGRGGVGFKPYSWSRKPGRERVS